VGEGGWREEVLEGSTLTVEHPGDVVDAAIFRAVIDAATDSEIELAISLD
jgi:hypothetical protein